MNWTEKYRARSIVEIVGNEEAKEKLYRYIHSWKEHDKSGVLIYGPAGVGKTASVYAIANDMGYHVIELNASDFRSAEQVYKKLEGVVGGYTLDSFLGGRRMRPLLFFDEVDGMDPREDTGGLKALIDIASRRYTPVVAAANFIDPVKHKELIQSFEVIEFKSLTPRQILVILNRIVLREGLDIDRDVLVKIAERSRGDARLAINLLYSVHMGSDIEAISNPLENLPIDILLRRLSAQSDISEIRRLLESNPQHWKDVLYVYFDSIVRSPVMRDDRRERLMKYVSLLDLMLGSIESRGAYFYMKYIPHILSWIVYQANRWGAIYDGRIPEYRFYMFISNRKVREEMEEVFNDLQGNLHESIRKFFVYSLPTFVSLNRNKYPSLHRWVERVFGGVT